MNGRSVFPVLLFGYLLIGAGVLYAMASLGLGSVWLVSIGLIILGAGLVLAMTRSRAHGRP